MHKRLSKNKEGFERSAVLRGVEAASTSPSNAIRTFVLQNGRKVPRKKDPRQKTECVQLVEDYPGSSSGINDLGRGSFKGGNGVVVVLAVECVWET